MLRFAASFLPVDDEATNTTTSTPPILAETAPPESREGNFGDQSLSALSPWSRATTFETGSTNRTDYGACETLATSSLQTFFEHHFVKRSQRNSACSLVRVVRLPRRDFVARVQPSRSQFSRVTIVSA